MGPGLTRPRWGCLCQRGSHRPWVHGGTWVQIGGFFPPSLLSKTLSRGSALSLLAGCPWRAACDTRSCCASPWQVAGGRWPLSLLHPEQLGLPGTPAAAGGDASLAFSPFSFFIFFPSSLSEEVFAPALPADGCRDSPARRKAERKAEGTRDAIACHLITLLFTHSFLQRGWASPADPAV